VLDGDACRTTFCDSVVLHGVLYVRLFERGLGMGFDSAAVRGKVVI